MIDNVFQDYEFILQDRIAKIQSVITNQENFYLSYSGGKDSVSLSHLLDLAIPNNNIQRVYCDTGIEYNAIKEFVLEQQKTDNRIIVIHPPKSIFETFKVYGYPFKSKFHSYIVHIFQNLMIRQSNSKTLTKYLNGGYGYSRRCPKILAYQFTDDFKLKLSDKCCYNQKKEPFIIYENKTGKKAILGIRKAEGGNRAIAYKGCILSDKKGNLKKFMPLFVVNDNFIKQFDNSENVKLCKLYGEPYNFKRTGCVGCPYNINLQVDLEMLYNTLPNEYYKAIAIWKPVYDEYIRIGYRLKYYPHLKGTQTKLDLK